MNWGLTERQGWRSFTGQWARKRGSSGQVGDVNAGGVTGFGIWIVVSALARCRHLKP